MARRTARIERSKVRTLGDATVTPTNPASVPPGALLTYVGTWRTTWTMRSDEVIGEVVARLAQSGLPARSSDYKNSSLLTNVSITPQNFDVTIVVQASGGFAKIQDAISIIDHTVNEVTGLFPLSSSVPLMNGQPTGMPGNPSGPNSATWSAWLQDNAGIIGVGLAAVLLSVALVKKF